MQRNDVFALRLPFPCPHGDRLALQVDVAPCERPQLITPQTGQSGRQIDREPWREPTGICGVALLGGAKKGVQLVGGKCMPLTSPVEIDIEFADDRQRIGAGTAARYAPINERHDGFPIVVDRRG